MNGMNVKDSDEFGEQCLPEGCKKLIFGNVCIDNYNAPWIFVGVGILITVLPLVASLLMYYWKSDKEPMMPIPMAFADINANGPPRPMVLNGKNSKLRTIKEEEMRKDDILGSGAFGNVYKGVWIAENGNVKTPVAVKVLHADTKVYESRNFLSQANNMALLDHPNLLPLLAVCRSSQINLVTRLMPHGCLLDYVRCNKDNIESRLLLKWCSQIARGMAYLEQRRIVHGNLAARNVLVQSSDHVKVTDFCFAELLESTEEDLYRTASAKMPYQWLSPECIMHREFTHKSDVWAFGVTVWEVLTYGEKPYEHMPMRKVLELTLHLGERLTQPEICGFDVYFMMILCWLPSPHKRPNFQYLSNEFSDMALEHEQYLNIIQD